MKKGVLKLLEYSSGAVSDLGLACRRESWIKESYKPFHSVYNGFEKFVFAESGIGIVSLGKDF